MTKTQHGQIMDCVSYLWADEEKEGLDEWLQIINLPKLFNENRKHVVMTITTKVLDESMSAFRPQSTAKENLPHLSHISRKPEDLEMEFKTAACTELKMMLAMELCQSQTDQEGKEFVQWYKNKKTTACCIHLLYQVDQRKRTFPAIQDRQNLQRPAHRTALQGN